MLSGEGGIVGVFKQGQELDSVIFLGPFHLRIFHDSMILIISPAPFASRACRELLSPALRVLLPTLAAHQVSQRHLLAPTSVVLGSHSFGSAQLQSAWATHRWDGCMRMGHILSFSRLFRQGRDPAWHQGVTSVH